MPPEGIMPPGAPPQPQPQGGAGLAGLMQAMGGPGGMPTGVAPQPQAGGLPPELLLQLIMMLLGQGGQAPQGPPQGMPPGIGGPPQGGGGLPF